MSPAYGNDSAAAIAVDAAGNTVVVGKTANYNETYFTVAKFDGTTGTRLWRTIVDTSGQSAGDAVVLDSHGDVFASGYMNSSGSSAFAVVKLSGADGHKINAFIHPTLAGEAQYLAVDAADNVIAAGYTGFTGPGGSVATVVEFNDLVQESWEHHSAVAGLDLITALAVDSNGDVVTGDELSIGGDVVKLAGQTGTQLWSVAQIAAMYGLTNLAVPQAVVVDQSHDVWAGTGNSVYRFDGANVLSYTSFDFGGPAFPPDTAVAKMAVAPDGSIYVGGTSGGQVTIESIKNGSVEWQVPEADTLPDTLLAAVVGPGYDFFGSALTNGSAARVFRLDIASGHEVWHADLSDAAFFGLATDSGGNVVGAGSIIGPDTSQDLLVHKLAGATGDPMWQQTLTGALPATAELTAVALDGDIIAVGELNGFTAVKMSPDTGEIRWRTTIAPHNPNPSPPLYPLGVFAQAFDHEGNLIIAGRGTFLDSSDNDAEVVKLNAQDGSVLWQHSIATPAGYDNGRPTASAIAIDSLDDIFVAVDYGADNESRGLVVELTDGGVETARTDLGPSSGSPAALILSAAGTPIALAPPNLVKLGAGSQVTSPVPDGGFGTTDVIADTAGNTYVAEGAPGVSAQVLKFDGAGETSWDTQYNLHNLGLIWSRADNQDPIDTEANLAKYLGNGPAIALEPAGDLILGGANPNGSGWAMLRLRKGDGTPVWTQSGMSATGVKSLRLDDAGDIVALTSDQVMKLADQGGGVIWSKSASQPGGVAGGQVALDAYGDVIVVGTNSDGEFSVSKLHGFDGTDFVTAPKNVTAPISAGGTVTTDTEDDGATEANPLETTVTSPTAGSVSITETSLQASPPAGYSILGEQATISAPNGTAQSPLKIVFRVDGSRIPPGVSADEISVFRNGMPVPNCTRQDGSATPDPCVSRRFVTGDGDVEITVLTSEASQWQLAVPVAATPVSGQLKLADNDSQPTKRKIKFVSHDAIVVGLPGSAGDPTCAGATGGGGALRVLGTGGSGQDTGDIDLPCAGWVVLGSPTKFKGWKYSDRRLSNGPCSSVKTTAKGIKVTCSAKNATEPIAYDLTANGEGSVSLLLRVGGTGYCTTFDPTTGDVQRDNATGFHATGVGPAVCPAIP